MPRSQGVLGIVAVLLGVVALGLAVIARAVFDVPPPWPTAPAPEPKQVVHGGKSFEWKGAKVTIGGQTAVVYPPPPQPIPMTPKVIFITTAVLALVGIALAIVSTWRDHSYMLGGPAVALCSAALLWHYILLGVIVGVAVFVLIMILAHLGA